MTTFEIPETMKRLVLKAPGKDVASTKIDIETVPVPELKSGQVLVKMAAAAVNPSDWHQWTSEGEDCPKAIGIEGCGVVVKKCGSWKSYLTPSIGQKVGVIGPKYGQGTYSEYVAMDAMEGAFPMPADLAIEDAASWFVNPYTALSIMDTAANMDSKAFIHTAAASQLGQMIVKHADEKGVVPINVVRRAEQVKLLQELGAKHVINTSDEDWKDQLKKKVEELDCKVAFDAVAGSMSADLMTVLPQGGSVMVYGGLGGNVNNISPLSLIYQKKSLRGFLVADWIQAGGMLKMMLRMSSAAKEVNSGLHDGWSKSQFKDTTMETVKDDFASLQSAGLTGTKLRIRIE